MAQFDVHANPDAASGTVYPYLIEIQADLLGELPTVVVVPLVDTDRIDHRPITRLMPTISVNRRNYVAMVPELAAVHRQTLSRPITALPDDEQTALRAALDLLLSGL